MSQLVDRSRSPAAGAAFGRTRARPVLLATLAVRVDPTAERMALESALEAGVKLILANLSLLPPYPATIILAREYATLPHEEDLDAVRATAARAAELGIATELLRVSSPRPVKALLELAQETDAGLLVFGPDLARTPRRRFRKAARVVRRDAPCLVWVAPDG
ncbi:MAG TPA: universal stress protein [Solirubrobacteraceae bacterium]|jgi:nucleotide-binding universal stress UspA family protein